jgi:hypothetical protein
MPEAVKARCPGCQRELRIPAEWISRAFRCKHCQTVIQVKPRAAAKQLAARLPQADSPKSPAIPSTAMGASTPVEKSPASSLTAAATGELAFPALNAGPIVQVPTRYRKSRLNRWARLAIVLLLVGIGGGAAGYFWTPLKQIGTAFRKALDEKPAKDSSEPAAKDNPVAGNEVFPRRVLAICVNNYLYANPVAYGTEENSVGSLLDRFISALHVDAGQVIELSDAARPRQPSRPANRSGKAAKARKPRPRPTANSPARPPLKPVIEKTAAEFLDGCRPQDRILLLFAGHIIEMEGEVFLVPLEGEFSVKETLIPLSWFLERLKKCPARQKVLVLDTCRLDPSHGLERPGCGPMEDKLDALCARPPEGIQVWSACVKGQYSYEFDGGSFFLKQILDALDDKEITNSQHTDDPLPMEALAGVVNKKVEAEIAAQLKDKQTPRLAGKEIVSSIVYDKTHALPPRLNIAEAAPPAGPVARPDEVKSILDEIDLPPIKLAREETARSRIEQLVPFSAKKLEEYRPDYISLKEIEGSADKFPLRLAVLKAIRLIRDRFDPKNGAVILREHFSGNTNDRVKAEILKEQARPAELLAELQEAKDALEKAGQKREEEASGRWQAHYDYILAQLKARIAYVEEYSLMLGKIRKGELPELEEGQTGFRLASREKLQGTKEFKDLAADAKKLFKKIASDHKGTPWEILAKREQLTALGLQWQATR